MNISEVIRRLEEIRRTYGEILVWADYELGKSPPLFDVDHSPTEVRL